MTCIIMNFFCLLAQGVVVKGKGRRHMGASAELVS